MHIFARERERERRTLTHHPPLQVRHVGSISILGGHEASRALVPLKGHFQEIKTALLCLLQNLGGVRAPSAPGPYVYAPGTKCAILPAKRGNASSFFDAKGKSVFVR